VLELYLKAIDALKGHRTFLAAGDDHGFVRSKKVGYPQPALCAGHLTTVPEGLLHACDQVGEPIPREAHGSCKRGIDLPSAMGALVGLDAERFVAHQVANGVRAVASGVQQGAAGQVALDAGVRFPVRYGIGQFGPHQADLADGAAVEGLT
jgi:hypothetical protein